jgi:hypothetical protein
VYVLLQLDSLNTRVNLFSVLILIREGDMPFKGKKTHPGQARASARKRTRQAVRRTIALQRQMRAANDAQDRQNRTPCEIVIRDLERITGSPHWSSAFRPIVQVGPDSERYFGGRIVATPVYFRITADLNRTSGAREMLSVLISLGYQLEELEVEFWDDPEMETWGRCVWYKDHASYHEKGRSRAFPEASSDALSMLRAMFKTEHAGDQEFTLMSTQMIAAALQKRPRFLFHKLLIFRRVVLSLPPSNYEKLAA